MAAPNLPIAVNVKVSGANVGEYVILRNLTQGGQLTQKLAGNERGTVFNPAPASQWVNGDELQVEMRGRLSGVSKFTLSSGTNSIKLSASADTSTPGISM